MRLHEKYFHHGVVGGHCISDTLSNRVENPLTKTKTQKRKALYKKMSMEDVIERARAYYEVELKKDLKN